MSLKVLKQNTDEIIYHVINSALAGALVFLGSLTAGQGFTSTGFFSAGVAALIVAATKFKQYWSTQEKEYQKTFFSFVHP